MEFYVVLFSLSVAFCSLTRVQSVSFTFTNKCAYTVWPATLTGAGSSSLSSTGFELAPGASNSLAVPNKWSGRLWARTGCSTDAAGKFVCSTADCASGQVGCNGAGAIPPATLAELTLSGYGSQDFYDISLVDGFNLPMSLTPSSDCNVTSCPANVNSLCPPELAVTEVDGSIAACQSACMALNQPQYCCSGNYNSPQTCKPTTYSLIFKKLCPQAYSYAYDDTTSTFTCASGSDYQITFCP